MPAYLFNHQQVRTALSIAGIGIGAGSPLARLPEAEPLQPGEPSFQKLADAHFLEPGDGRWRVNTLAVAALLACAQPHEVIAVGATGGDGSGFAACRRGPLVAECTIGGGGLVKLSFPLTRSAIQLMVVSALSSDRPEAPSTGFRFQGAVPDAFILAVALREARTDAGGIAAESVGDVVAKAADDPNMTLPFVLAGGAEPLLALARSSEAVAPPVTRLLAAGHLRRDGDKLVPSAAAVEALSGPPLAGFVVSRTVVTEGKAASQTLQAIRVGERTIVYRRLRRDGEPLLEWSEVTRAQLRSLVAAMLMDERELRAIVGAEQAPVPVASVGPTCPGCGTEYAPGQRFCRQCGRRLAEG